MRTYRPKNSFCPYSKRSDTVFIAVLTCYVRGLTASRAGQILTRWNKRRGGKSISRQSVQERYKRSGAYLWMLAFEYRHDRKPDKTDTPESDLSAIRDFVYKPDRVSEIEKTISESRLLQWMKLDPIAMANDEVINRLREQSKRMRGLAETTFYIQWARIFWLVQIEGKLKCTTRKAQSVLLEKLLDAYQSPPDYADVVDQDERYEYFKYGTVLARIHWDRQNNPDTAEKYCYDTDQMIPDINVLEEVYLFGADGLWEVSESQFQVLLSMARTSPEEIRYWKPDS